MNYSEIKTNAAKIVTLETAIAEGYRALQSKLKDFQEKKIVYLQVKLNSSFAVLKAEAERIIESYRPIAETQAAIETVEQKTDEVLASLPAGTIANDSDFDVRTSDTQIPQNPTATIEQKLETEAEIYRQKFEAVVASLPVSTVVSNQDFESRKILGTPDQKVWLSKKAKHPSDIVILKVSNLSAIAYAGDALRLIAILGTRSLVEGGTLKTHIPMLDLEGVLHKAKKNGFSIKVNDADQTVILHKPSLTLCLHDCTSKTETSQEADATTKSELPEALESSCNELTDRQTDYLNKLDPMSIYRQMSQENAVKLAPGTYDKWRDVQELLGVRTLPRHIARQKYGYSSVI